MSNHGAAAIRPLNLARALAGLAVLLLGCSAAGTGNFEPTGYRHSKWDYSVAYAAADSQEVLGPNWKLDNYYVLKRGTLKPKQGADYESTYYVDYDGDGDADDLGEQYTYDLRFTHKRNSGVIWLRTLPLENGLEAKELRVLVRDFVAAMSGTHYETVQLKGELVHVGQERTYAIEELDSAAGTVARQPAFRMNLHVVDVDQHKVSPDANRRRVQLVLIKTPFRLAKSWGKIAIYDLPVVMLAGCAAHAEDFPAALPDFESFLRQLSIARRRGVEFRAAASGKAAPAASQPATPAEPQAAPPAEPPAPPPSVLQ